MNDRAGGPRAAVKVDGLTKKFDSFVAVDNISFTVSEGEVFGFLGPNGAGKSTTIRMLCGIIRPTSGVGHVGGFSILDDSAHIKTITGYMSQKFSLYGDLTPYENLDFFGGVYGLPRSQRRERIEWALEMSNLSHRRNDLTGELPGGFKQRLALGAAILHKPSLLFLDEPTAGVDPLSRRSFWDLIYQLSSEGVTVFVTTHYMDEAEHCDRIAFIDKGRLIKLNSPAALRKEGIRGHMLEIITPDWLAGFHLLRSNEQRFGEASLFGARMHLAFIGDDLSIIDALFHQNDLRLESVREIVPSLEDVFVSVLRPEETGNRTT